MRNHQLRGPLQTALVRLASRGYTVNVGMPGRANDWRGTFSVRHTSRRLSVNEIDAVIQQLTDAMASELAYRVAEFNTGADLR